MKTFRILYFLSFIVLFPATAFSGVEINEFSSAEQEREYKKLVNELRCLVCQNQNLADSNSELAQDLRKEVYQMLEKGNSNDEIIDFMVARYGDFVLYKPPFKPVTFLLWLGPFVLLFLAVLVVAYMIKNNQQAEVVTLDKDEKLRAEKLLNADAENRNNEE